MFCLGLVSLWGKVKQFKKKKDSELVSVAPPNSLLGVRLKL